MNFCSILVVISLMVCSLQIVSADYDGWGWGMSDWDMPWAWSGAWGGNFNNNFDNGFNNNFNNFWMPNPFLSNWFMNDFDD